jgi:hypothetical protein
MNDLDPAQESLRRSAEALSIDASTPLEAALTAVRSAGIAAGFTASGSDRDTVGYLAALAELAGKNPAVALAVHDDAMFDQLLATESNALKSIQGEKFGCIGLGPLQIAQRSGEWLLNGTVKLVTNASHHEHMIAFAEPLDRGMEPPRAFLLSLTATGASGGPEPGRAASTIRLAHAPALLAFGDDDTVARFVSSARLGVAATALGLARRILVSTVRSIKTRDRGVERGPTGQATQFALSDMATEIDAAWLVTLEAGSRRDAGASFETAAAEAKVLACPTARRVVERATQIAGASALANELDQAAAFALFLSRAHTTDAQDISTIASSLLEES